MGVSLARPGNGTRSLLVQHFFTWWEEMSLIATFFLPDLGAASFLARTPFIGPVNRVN
jgi:hypothetical protein